MKNLTPEEKDVLALMNKDNFRGISKENVMQLVTILDKVDPEVAKSLIAQMPEAVKGIFESEKLYADILKEGIESSERNTISCFQTEDEIIKTLQKEIDKEGVSFEEKQYYFEKMEEAAKRKECKDAEQKNVIIKFLGYGGTALFFGVVTIAGLFLGKTELTLPSRAG